MRDQFNNSRRIHFLSCFKSLFSIGICTLILSCNAPQQPNVIFIAVDDLRTELGIYGHSQMNSPNMDAIARQGSYFTHHYVHVPTCGASRYALLTGLRPTLGVHLTNKAIASELSEKPEGAHPESFIHRLKQEGYHTVGIGKISHSADGLLYGYEEAVSGKRELPHSWDELVFNSGKWQTGWNAFFGYANGENRQSLGKQVRPYEKGDVDDKGYVDGLTTELAIAKLQDLKKQKQPFFLGVGFFKPHLPFNAPKKYWELYDRAAFSISANPGIPQNINEQSLHNSGEFNQYALGDEKAGLSTAVSDAYARKLRHAYYASVSYIDAQIGRIREQLKQLNLDKNTIIVIWGDHGWHLGDQQIWGKHTLFENALKSPLIIYSPYESHQNNKIESIVETVDIYPTLLDLCGIKAKQQLDGESLKPLLNTAVVSDNATAYSYFKKGISLRTSKYRLTKYYRKELPNIELYDHSEEEPERNNIAKDYPEVVKELLPLLEKGNTGLYDEK
ncbi:sulfatase [Muriicola sp. Z0-33]|nr:sulfatase [Muriicola sp. Z0-33]